jgi:glucose-1-phosphate cytidylyltransferase
MKAVILAGGLGTRLGEETNVRPKPMVEIGGMPIIWHIMKIYSAYGINDFVVCLGYKGYLLKEYFANYFLHTADVTIDLTRNSMEVHQNWSEPWRITLVETGAETMTGGRLKRIRSYLNGDDAFCFTYGDGLASIDIGELIAFPPRAWSAGHDHRRGASGSLRRARVRGRPRSQLSGKAERGWRLDQRRLLRRISRRSRS